MEGLRKERAKRARQNQRRVARFGKKRKSFVKNGCGKWFLASSYFAARVSRAILSQLLPVSMKLASRRHFGNGRVCIRFSMDIHSRTFVCISFCRQAGDAFRSSPAYQEWKQERLRRVRARNRWHLFVLLHFNVGLRAFRKHLKTPRIEVESKVSENSENTTPQ